MSVGILHRKKRKIGRMSSGEEIQVEKIGGGEEYKVLRNYIYPCQS